MISSYASMRASHILKVNIATLLRIQHKDQKDLAFACDKDESWISKILSSNPSNRDRVVSTRDLDNIGEFFGKSAYELFRPGLDHSTERRNGRDRRVVKERRIDTQQRAMLRVAADIDEAHPRRKGQHESPAPSQSPAVLRALADLERQITALVSLIAEPRDKAPAPRRKVAGASKGHRAASGSDAGKA